jgi:predicted  nucleic acid-binding Zn-ribbon protein
LAGIPGVPGLSPRADGNNPESMAKTISAAAGLAGPNAPINIYDETQMVNAMNENSHREFGAAATEVTDINTLVAAYRAAIASLYGATAVASITDTEGVGADGTAPLTAVAAANPPAATATPSPSSVASAAPAALQVPTPAAAPPTAVAEASQTTTADLSAANQNMAIAQTKLAETKQEITSDQGQLASLKAQEEATSQKITAIKNVVQGTVDLGDAKAGLAVMNTFGMFKQTPTPEDVRTMSDAAAATKRLVTEVPSLGPQITTYNNLLDSMKLPQNQTLANLGLVKSEGAALVGDVAGALATMKKSASPADLANLQSTLAKLTANVSDLNKSIATLQKSEAQQVAAVTSAQQRLRELAARPQAPIVWKPLTTSAATTQ